MPTPTEPQHPSEVWVLKAVFSASAIAFVAFWVLMLSRVPSQVEVRTLRDCYRNQDQVRAALRGLAERKGRSFRELMQATSKGATVGPLFKMLEEEKLIGTPPPHTPECRSWKDYTAITPQKLEIKRVACRMHGRGTLHEPSRATTEGFAR